MDPGLCLRTQVKSELSWVQSITDSPYLHPEIGAIYIDWLHLGMGFLPEDGGRVQSQKCYFI
jgi:hypothetical protein